MPDPTDIPSVDCRGGRRSIADFAHTIAGPAVDGDSVVIAARCHHNAMCTVQFALDGAKEVWRKKFPSKVCTPFIHKRGVYVAWNRLQI